MVKPENVIYVRSRRFSGYGDYCIKCEDCGNEFHRAILNDRTSPYCTSCYKARTKQRNYNYQKEKLKAAYDAGYNAGFEDAVKAYKERDELLNG